MACMGTIHDFLRPRLRVMLRKGTRLEETIRWSDAGAIQPVPASHAPLVHKAAVHHGAPEKLERVRVRGEHEKANVAVRQPCFE